MKKMLLVLCLVISSFAVFAAEGEDHALSTMRGTDIDLKTFQHAFAGSIGEAVVFGYLDEPTFKSQITIRKLNQTITAFFGKTETGVGGSITRMDGDREVTTNIVFKNLVPAEKKMVFDVNGSEATITITPEDFQDGHFVNPLYTLVLDGKTYEYKFIGAGCYGLSIHWGMVVMAALAL